MEFRVLEYFVTIADYRNITHAAEALYISQSTLSRQIMDLEKELEVKLFERSRKGISLTEEGLFLYSRAKEMIQLAVDTEGNLKSGQTLSGTLRIGLGEDSHVTPFLLSVVKELQAKNPEITLDYKTLDADQIYRDIDLGLLDFGIIWTNDALSQYEFLDLPFENYWGLLFPSDDELAKKAQLTIKDLNNRNVIIPRQLDVHSDLQHYLREKAKNVRITATYDMYYNLLALVRAQIGIALTFNKIEFESSTEFTFKKLEGLRPISAKIVWNSNRKHSRLSATFLKVMKKYL